MDQNQLQQILQRSEQLRAKGARVFNRALNNRLTFAAAADETLIDIYDEIGFFGISAGDIRQRLKSITTPNIKVRINSPGGDVFDGIAIHNDLKDHPAKVHVEIVSLAASAASIIAMAGDTITMADNAFLMIHNAWSIAIGDKNLMDDMAVLLDQIDGALATTYAQRTKLSEKEIARMMDDETWLDAKTAREKGFADPEPLNVTDGDANALFDLSVFSRVPSALKQRVESGLRDAGLTRREARSATADGFGRFGQRDVARHGEQRDVAHADTVAGLKSLVDAFSSR